MNLKNLSPNVINVKKCKTFTVIIIFKFIKNIIWKYIPHE